MTYMTCARRAAYQESVALRAYARTGRLPRCAPVDLWDEWQRAQHENTTSYREGAA